MINYKPSDAVRVWPEGTYRATLEKSEETTSQAGNDMYALTFKAYDGSSSMLISDWIVMPDFTWKLKKLADALGALDEFNKCLKCGQTEDAHTNNGECAFQGSFNPVDYENKNLALSMKIEKARGGFDECNRIKAYLRKDMAPAVAKEEEDVDALFG